LKILALCNRSLVAAWLARWFRIGISVSLCSLAHGLLHGCDASSDLEEKASAAAEDANEHALGDEQALEGRANVFHGDSAIVNDQLILLRAVLSISAVAEDTRDNDGGELGAATAHVAACSEKEHGVGEDCEDSAQSERSEASVHDGVQEKHCGPLRRANCGIACQRGLHIDHAAGVEGVVGFAASRSCLVVEVSGEHKKSPIETHVRGGDDEGDG